LKLQNALKGLLKVPAIYAIILAILFVRFDWTLAEPLQRTVTLASGAAIPSMLVLLGLELQRATWTRRVRALSIPVFSRLVASPLIALGLTALFGLPLPARQAAISEAGMPSAVLTTVLATEYGLDSSLVTAIVFLTTLLSPLTLTPLLTYLGS